jgi:CheY-like chemotaxis protein
MARVLVVDDEPLIRFDLAEFLRKRQYEVDEARDGKTAIDLIKTKSFDAVISDYRMPGAVNGVDLLNYYHLHYPEKVKVLITAYGTEGTQKQVEALGRVFLRKPLLHGDLLRALARPAHP